MKPPTIRLPPAVAVSVLARAGYGARPEDVAALGASGFGPWLEQQLAPRDGEDPAEERLKQLQLRIRYGADAKSTPPRWPATDEMRALALLDQPIEGLWPLITRRGEMEGAERRRARDEVIAATIFRAVHSRWQLREAMVGFWHDHFNVDAFASDEVAVALPVYDREVIRGHALGNFREMLEAVATSAAMLYYLSNRSSRAGAANENFGRELFELHTLGRDAYLNDRYDRWKSVPGALKGAPAGYIDEDVYEAARAFTGWTVEDGTGIDGQRRLPASGRFAYVESWHDGYQKRVLAEEFREFSPAMADGRRVLDLVADHPATARFLCTKICRRLIADEPPPRVVDAAVRSFTQARRAKDQIARTLRTILLSPEFMASRGAKLRRPLALAAAFARASGIPLTPTEPLPNMLAACGQRLFGWPTPAGLPDESAQFLGVHSMRQRWALLLGLAENAWGTGALPLPPALVDRAATPRAAATHFAALFAGQSDPATVEALLGGLGWPADEPLGDPARPDFGKRVARIAALAAMAPGFQSA